MTTEQPSQPSGEQSVEAKKLSQAEAAKKLLAQKKQNNQGKGPGGQTASGGQKMKSQMTKKVNNQRKKMGT